MAYTQTQLLDAFCREHDYVNFALDGETKQQFLVRKRKEWSKIEALKRLRLEQRIAADEAVDSKVVGVDF